LRATRRARRNAHLSADDIVKWGVPPHPGRFPSGHSARYPPELAL